MLTEKTAIVLIDDDNDFLSEEGILYGIVKQVLDDNRVIDNINALLKTARQHGIYIIHVPIMFSSDYQEMGESPYGIFNVVKNSGAFQRNTWGARVADVIDVQDSDIIIEGKSTTCAFKTTDLKKTLDELNIKTIALGGLLTNICIESTMRTAYDLGYNVYTLTDCSATLNEASQKSSIEINWPIFSKPMKHDEFINNFISQKFVDRANNID